MKVYISGPISSDEYYERKFQKVAEELRDYGYEVVNPAEKYAEGLIEPSYQECLDADLERLAGCDAIYMLRGWQRSPGARVEHEYARATEKWIAYQR